VSVETAPPALEGGLRRRVLLWAAHVALRATLTVSPKPAVLIVRKTLAPASGDRLKRALDKHAPDGVLALTDERYGDAAEMVMDVVRPGHDDGSPPLPLVLWVHGGGWVAGSKDELLGYCKIIASQGYVVAAPDYSLVPGSRYPTPLRQLMQALGHLQRNAGRYRADTARIVIAGDSAGAQLAAQLGALVTTPGYASAVGVAPAITASQLRGVVLACGPYDLGLLCRRGMPVVRDFVTAVMWAYSGTRRFRDDPRFATWSVANHVTPAFPPALITVGNRDWLRPHSELLAGALSRHGVQAETVFFADDHRPRVEHEYQFFLDRGEAALFLERMLTFLEQRLGQW
jgi:acetyl esterase/lipase